MGNDFIARKQRRKEAKRNGDGDGAPRRIRKKKQPKRICRGGFVVVWSWYCVEMCV